MIASIIYRATKREGGVTVEGSRNQRLLRPHGMPVHRAQKLEGPEESMPFTVVIVLTINRMVGMKSFKNCY